MSQLLSQLSETIVQMVATAAPLLTAIRVGENRHVTGLLWRNDLIVTADQSLPAAARYTIVLSTGDVISALPGPRDPSHNLASLRLDIPVSATLPEPARSAAIGSLMLALGANFDGSPTVRLTTIHSSARSSEPEALITLDLAGGRVSQGGSVLDAKGRLLGMTSAAPGGDTIVLPYHMIGRFVDAACGVPHTGMAAAIAQAARVAQANPAENSQTPGGSQTSLRQPRGWLGVSLQPITVPDNLAHRAGQRTARQVVGITRGGPADRAGLRSGDVLLALDGSSTTGNHALRAFLAPDRIGTEVEVRLMRDGLIHTTILTIAAQPER